MVAILDGDRPINLIKSISHALVTMTTRGNTSGKAKGYLVFYRFFYLVTRTVRKMPAIDHMNPVAPSSVVLLATAPTSITFRKPDRHS